MLLNKAEINRIKIKPNEHSLECDQIAVEEPLQISLQQAGETHVFSLIMRTPGHDSELVNGVLFTEGIITSAVDIEKIAFQQSEAGPDGNLLCVFLNDQVKLDLSEKKRQYPSYSGCGLCGKTSLQALELKRARQLKRISIKLNLQLVSSLKALLAKQPLFSETGGVHAAGLVYEINGKLFLQESPFFEDVGRHNALDKLIGHELIANDLSQGGILLLSGRIGFELVQKAVLAGFSMIIALGAPSNLAIQAAKQFDLVLVGFAKDNSFNLYTADQHLLD